MGTRNSEKRLDLLDPLPLESLKRSTSSLRFSWGALTCCEGAETSNFGRLMLLEDLDDGSTTVSGAGRFFWVFDSEDGLISLLLSLAESLSFFFLFFFFSLTDGMGAKDSTTFAFPLAEKMSSISDVGMERIKDEEKESIGANSVTVTSVT